MKKATYLFYAVLIAIFAIGAGRGRYAPDYWVFDTGGIKYVGGNVDITSGTLDVSGIVSLGTDIYVVTKTVIKTIDLNASPSTDDFQFNNTIADSVAQNKDLGTLIPAWAEVVSCKIRCFEGIGNGNFEIRLGTTSGATNLLGQTTIDDINELVGTAATAGPVIATTAAAQNVWMWGDPSINWDASGSAGRWAVIITYIDYSAVFTAKNP